MHASSQYIPSNNTVVAVALQYAVVKLVHVFQLVF